MRGVAPWPSADKRGGTRESRPAGRRPATRPAPSRSWHESAAAPPLPRPPSRHRGFGKRRNGAPADIAARQAASRTEISIPSAAGCSAASISTRQRQDGPDRVAHRLRRDLTAHLGPAAVSARARFRRCARPTYNGPALSGHEMRMRMKSRILGPEDAEVLMFGMQRESATNAAMPRMWFKSRFFAFRPRVNLRRI